MKKLLAIVFLVIFSFQVVPVKALGKLLSKGQTEEEVKKDCDSGDDCDNAGKYLDLIHHTANTFTATTFMVVDKVAIWHYADVLPVSHVADIPSPPPNR